MRDGTLVQFGTPNELLSEPADDLVKQLIETPRTRARRLAQVLQASA
jgi:ABC-type proline/glycine betaine transport system ATPase subunit